MFLFVSLVILPASIGGVTNTLIYLHVRSSSRRVQGPVAFTASHRSGVNRRDIFLLKHMIILLGVFLVGWVPWLIIEIVECFSDVSDLATYISCISFQLALLVDIVDLFLYNHEVRRYLIGLCLSCCRK